MNYDPLVALVSMTPMKRLTEENSKKKSRWGSNTGDLQGVNRNEEKPSKWGSEDYKPFLPQPFVDFPPGLTPAQLDQFLREQRYDELTVKLSKGELEYIDPDIRPPSPPPIYDKNGSRINTREARIKNSMIEEYNRLVEYLLKHVEGFVAPPNYKPIKKIRKIEIPIDEYPEYNFMGLIIGPRGCNHKRLEAESGAQISIRGKGTLKEGKKTDHQTEIEANMPKHVHISADTEESIEKAVNLIIPLLDPKHPQHEEHKRKGLEQLAIVNGINISQLDMQKCTFCGSTTHVSADCAENSNFQNFKKPEIKCNLCGDHGHITLDCKLATDKKNSQNNDDLDISNEPKSNKQNGTHDTNTNIGSSSSSSSNGSISNNNISNSNNNNNNNTNNNNSNNNNINTNNSKTKTKITTTTITTTTAATIINNNNNNNVNNNIENNDNNNKKNSGCSHNGGGNVPTHIHAPPNEDDLNKKKKTSPSKKEKQQVDLEYQKMMRELTFSTTNKNGKRSEPYKKLNGYTTQSSSVPINKHTENVSNQLNDTYNNNNCYIPKNGMDANGTTPSHPPFTNNSSQYPPILNPFITDKNGELNPNFIPLNHGSNSNINEGNSTYDEMSCGNTNTNTNFSDDVNKNINGGYVSNNNTHAYRTNANPPPIRNPTTNTNKNYPLSMMNNNVPNPNNFSMGSPHSIPMHLPPVMPPPFFNSPWNNNRNTSNNTYNSNTPFPCPSSLPSMPMDPAYPQKFPNGWPPAPMNFSPDDSYINAAPPDCNPPPLPSEDIQKDLEQEK